MENTKTAQPIYEDVDENDIDSILKAELKEKGLEYRFIDFKQAKQNGGRSRNGWIVYKRDSDDPRLQGISSLADPDGLVRQGSMVLAVKTIAGAEKQRTRIKNQNQLSSKYNEHITNEVEQEARRLGGSSRAIQGYDKNS
jgi:hypothetical protein